MVKDLIAHASRRQPLLLGRANLLEILAKFYERSHSAQTPELVAELIEYHAREVNPTEISVSGRFWENLSKEDIWQSLPYLRHYCAVAQYATDWVTQRAAGPATAALLDVKSLDNLAKTKPQEASRVNSLLKALREKYLAALQRGMALSQARIEVARLGAAIVRTLFGRALPKEMCWEGISPHGEVHRREDQGN